MMKVGIVGGSGYVGGEILRLLVDHPQVEVTQITSNRLAGSYAHAAHPNLRGRTELRFTGHESVEAADLLFLCLPHGKAATEIDRYAALAPRIVDCSADFRLRDPDLYDRWYGWKHPNPEWLSRFTYGLPELHRAALRTATYVSGVGCNATAVNMALWPFVSAGIIDRSKPIIAEVKAGSSEGGAESSSASHHPERAGIVRSYAPVGHRHTAEIVAQTGIEDVHLSVTSVEMVRGVAATCHFFASRPLAEKDIWKILRSTWADQPFVRIVHDRTGIHRHPEPRLLAGSNFVDVGFSVDEQSGRVVALAAMDNLMKGAAGSAVQCMNLMCGFEERTALGFTGLHP